ncbi:hypothetical protein HW932_19340 [Allochromatium humboldtianum]|uniref:Uncharacterized protein n=1 Tax=Allochromatium humboldtianum TaxID=504901 RepID=A0A850R9K2_9GAMM|nr:hypothetical protein [Allochromatium humboldtianum]NVZ11409.1 hypothetical protein [Allochromatium humboldtianum]
MPIPLLVWGIGAAVAAAAAATAIAVNSDSESSSSSSDEERRRLEREAKEARAKKERDSIMSYVKTELENLRTIHAPHAKSVQIPSFEQLRTKVATTQSQNEILRQLQPQLVKSENEIAARQKIASLEQELKELRQARKALASLSAE